MKLKAYINGLKSLIKDNPKLANATAVYSRDDEGNGFQEVFYSPSVGVFEDGEFMDPDDYESVMDVKKESNAVCVN